MVAFFIENSGTIIVGGILLVIVAAIVAKMVKDVRKGKFIGCDCGCSECSRSGACSTNRE